MPVWKPLAIFTELFCGNDLFMNRIRSILNLANKLDYNLPKVQNFMILYASILLGVVVT